MRTAVFNTPSSDGEPAGVGYLQLTTENLAILRVARTYIEAAPPQLLHPRVDFNLPGRFAGGSGAEGTDTADLPHRMPYRAFVREERVGDADLPPTDLWLLAVRGGLMSWRTSQDERGCDLYCESEALSWADIFQED